MKRLSFIGLALTLVMSLSACGAYSDAPPQSNDNESRYTEQSTSAAEIETTYTTAATVTKTTPKTLGEFSKTAEIEETVMIDENDVKITATGLKYTSYSVELELDIENNSDKALSFISGSLGYSCNSINGYMISDGYLNCDIAAGKKANDSISFSYDGLMLYGITDISDIEIGFYTSDDDYNYTYYTPRQIKTSAFELHDYSKNCYQETISSDTAMNTYNYDITYFSTDSLYNENGVNLLSSGIMVNRDDETILLVELENTNDSMINMSTSDIAINGLTVCSSTWSSTAINAGKRCIIDINLSSALDSEYWDIYGIKEVGSVSFSLKQYNADGGDITEEIPIEIAIPDTPAEYDADGKEIYNSNGVRIVAKTVIEDSSEYSSDMYILLLAENIGENTISIDDVYDSLSVNGYMTDYSYYSQEIKSGKSAVIEIKLWKSSLESNNIKSVSDIKEVEIGFEIERGRDTIDEPTVTILFE